MSGKFSQLKIRVNQFVVIIYRQLINLLAAIYNLDEL